MKLYNSTWPQIEAYLKRSNTLILPIGSTEQHGPTGLIGTDYMTAWKISERVAEEIDVVVGSPVCYGMAQHHMGFPGTASLSPLTYIRMITEILQSYIKHGFTSIFLVNGHGGNIASLLSAFSEVKHDTDQSRLELLNWWRLTDVQTYEQEHFGDENGFHATPGEVSLTMHLESEAFESIEKQNFEVEPLSGHAVHSPVEFRNTFKDGRMASNPGLATAEHGKALYDIATDSIKRTIQATLE